jgi:hypothetical protein
MKVVSSGPKARALLAHGGVLTEPWERPQQIIASAESTRLILGVAPKRALSELEDFQSSSPTVPSELHRGLAKRGPSALKTSEKNSPNALSLCH